MGAPYRAVDGPRPVGTPTGQAQDVLGSRPALEPQRMVAGRLLALYNADIIPLTFPSSGRYSQRGR
jgi:hypothetical protein